MLLPGRPCQNLVRLTLPLAGTSGREAGCDSRERGCHEVMNHGWMHCSTGPSETELAAHPAASIIGKTRPQAFYSSFSQWPFSQVMPDQA